jgi:hypothetical protein
VPTVIVPDTWRADEHEGESILMGLDGRHTSGPVGLWLRSTTRTILHYCERPVAIVPTGLDS